MNEIEELQNKDVEITKEKAEMTAGDMLRIARTTGRRKREVATIAKQLCISEEFLQALEDGDYKRIPEIVYILGFARNYALELGLDPDEIVAKIKSELGIVTEAEITLTKEDLEEKSQKKLNVDFNKIVEKLIGFIRKYWLWCSIGLGVIIIFIVLLLLFGGSETTNVGDTMDKTEIAVTAEDVYAKDPIYNIPVRERFGTENADKAKIILQAIEDSYVKITDSKGKVIFGRSMVSGDVFYVPRSGNYTAGFGNAGGVDVWVDGVLAPKVGPSHMAKDKIILSSESLLTTKGQEE